MTKRWRGQRFLLNGRGFQGTAAVIAEIEDTRRWKLGCDGEGKPLDTYNAQPDYIVKFSDCDRTITFTLDFGDEAAHKNSLRKVDLMIAALSALRPALEDEQTRYAARAVLVAANEEAKRAAKGGAPP